MKKQFMPLLMFALATLGFASCDPKNNGEEPELEKKEYRLQKLSFLYNWENMDEAKAKVTSWTYSYDTNGRVIKVVETGEDWAETMVFDYSKAGQVTFVREEVEKNRILLLNDKNLVTSYKNAWGDGGDVNFEYDANGMLLKIYEDYGEPELKSTFTIENGNAVSFTRSDRVKGFTFSSGLNLGNIHQVVNDNFIDDWKAHTGLFGAANKNLNTEVKWSDKEAVTKITYDFYEDGRVKRSKRTDGATWFEYYDYVYEEIVK
jgi:hypothetical protein